MSVKRAQQEIDSYEFAEWMAMEKIDGPAGWERLDILLAHMLCVLLNQMRGLWSKSSRKFKLKDCLITWTPKERPSQVEIQHKLEMWAQGVNEMYKGDKK